MGCHLIQERWRSWDAHMQVQSIDLARLLYKRSAAAAADDGAGHGGGDPHCGG